MLNLHKKLFEVGSSSPESGLVLSVASSPLASTLAAANIGVWQVDMSTGLGTWDAVTSEILGLGSVEQVSPMPLPIYHEDRADAVRRMNDNLLNLGEQNVEVRVVRPDGELRWIRSTCRPPSGDHEQVGRLVGIVTDITNQKNAEQEVRWAASHDSLTRLGNRSLFQQRIDEAVAAGAATGLPFALLLIDIDDFKRINDTLGHDAGDAVLCTVADRLNLAVKAGDTVARLGGDEFAVVLKGVKSAEEAEAAVTLIFASLGEPFFHGGRLLECQASIGASLYPSQGKNRTEMLKSADIALYAAKAGGRARLEVFSPKMCVEFQRRASMLDVAKNALESDLIIPFYQPKIDFCVGAVVGFEALLRWRDPAGGFQGPDTLAAAFEDLPLAMEIGDRMTKKVIQDMRTWLDRGVDFGHVAINAVSAEFRRGDFAERLLGMMERHSIPLSKIQLEVTETVFSGRGVDYVGRALRTLSEAGVRIALDDFGTGYASLSHLRQFPVNIVKIDRSFVLNMVTNPDDAAIIDAVINLGRSLNIEVVTEGIETEAQQAALAALGCRVGQGFLYGPAIASRYVPRCLVSQTSNQNVAVG